MGLNYLLRRVCSEMRKGIPVLQEALGRMEQPISRIASQIDQVEDHLQSKSCSITLANGSRLKLGI